MPTFRVGKPRIQLRRTTDQTPVAAGVITPIIWQTATQEDPVVWSPSTPSQYPITKTGLYLVVLQARYLTAGGTYFLLLYRNTVRTAETAGTGLGGSALQVSYLSELDAGDYLEAQSYRSSGAYTIEKDATFMSVTRVGPDRWTG